MNKSDVLLLMTQSPDSVHFRAVDTVLFQPVYWFREKVVEPMRGESQAWYHRKYPRVTGIEDCYTDDVVCR